MVDYYETTDISIKTSNLKLEFEGFKEDSDETKKENNSLFVEFNYFKNKFIRFI